MLFEKRIKRWFSFKAFEVVLLVFVICFLSVIGVFLHESKDVIINTEGNLMIIRSMNNTVKEVLHENKVQISDYDYISLPFEQKLQKKNINIINIKKAVPVIVEVDGEITTVMTLKDTVGEALKEEPVKLFYNDKIIGAERDDKVVGNMEVKVVRVSYETIIENEIIPYEVIERESSKMDIGEQSVVEEGKEGLIEKQYFVKYEDGKETERELQTERILEEPSRKIIEYGTVVSHVTSRGERFRYKDVIDMRATAYTASYECTGKTPDHPHFGITYTGIRAKRGVVAVDPKVIPLGTRLYIEGIGGVPDYGYALAADIGSAVKGNKVDLYMDDLDSVRQWGVRNVRVYILRD
ncbi:UNVERIFIED_CONTAM: hypothetical protein Cloal_3393 [Acetivibrio alkalicellulosi]